jgi:hypothetical protein
MDDTYQIRCYSMILVKLSGGRIIEATIKAIVEHPDSQRLQVDFGKDEAALIQE